MTSAVFDNALVYMGKGTWNWTAAQTTFWVGLGNTNFGANVNKATWDTYADTTTYQVASGNGYTTGGEQLVVATVALNSNVAQFDADNTAWTASSFTSYYAYTHYGATRTTDGALITYHDFGTAKTVESGTLTLEWDGAGVWKVTISAAA